MWRRRNELIVKAQTAERSHGLTLHVHIRGKDLDYFNEPTTSTNSVTFLQHLLDLLDGNEQFQSLVKELDNVNAIDELIKTKGSSSTTQQMSSSRMKVDWQISAQFGLNNVLRRSNRPRSECFTRTTERDGKKHVETQEVYNGGMYRPLPMRKVAVSVWMYPPHVVIPSTGDRIPVNDVSIHDFFNLESSG